MSLYFDNNYDNESSADEDDNHQRTQFEENSEHELLVNLVTVGDYIFVKVFTEGNRHKYFIVLAYSRWTR